ncbi:MAG: hypothetical protein LBN12_06400 [Clostridiales Family XIII bacterium]|jgi:hypothetical protein|nr:hypothetical protein [Clostridiales Family XIII bacterium]
MKSMKKVAALLLFGLAVFALSACGGGSNSSSDSSSGKVEVDSDSSEQTVVNAPTVEEQVVFDQDGVVVTVKGLTLGQELFSFGPELQVLIENNSSSNVLVQSRDGVVNGIMVEPYLSSEVTAGNKANSEITFFSSSLEKAGIEQITDIEFKLAIIDPNTYSDISASAPIIIQTSAAGSFTQTYDDSGTVMFDQDGIKIVAKRLDDQDSFWGADIYLYIENNTNQDVIIQSRDCSVNGFMIDPFFSSDILAEKKAFSEISFLQSDLESNDIESIDKLDLSFTIINADSWDEILKSDIITVNFS